MSPVNILIVGGGGREHALAWKLAQSPRAGCIWCAPGNGGTDACNPNPGAPIANVDLAETDFAGLIAFARQEQIGLMVVGPEAPLADGIVDAFEDAGLRVFGPTQRAAQIEASKAFAKAFMDRHAIPTGRYATFDDHAAALAHLRAVTYPVVIKASGLAAGKGVIVPETLQKAEDALHQIMIERAFGDAGAEVLIEERLTGPEVSLLAFSDGRTIIPMPPAQDHKRELDGDLGPNTGGMGAYAPAPWVTERDLAAWTRTILQPTVDGMRREGIPYKGILYAGLMLTPDGSKVLEFNCRFGDPETQVILPLLESDLLDILTACTEERLAETEVRWRDGAAATVVAASGGYPGSYARGLPITGMEDAGAIPGAAVFHAGTRRDDDGTLLTNGGRVLAVTGIGPTLDEALITAYRGIHAIRFDGMHYRRDIGKGACPAAPARERKATVSSAYRDAGVDIDAGARAIELMKDAVCATYGPEVLLGIGAFGGLFDASALKAMAAPVLVASTDGVGTKTKIAAMLGHYDSIGQDIVNHCINDILVQGARPLFFMDYIAMAKLDPVMVAEVVRGCAEACRLAGCALLGGETAEMPGVYAPGEFDLVGTIVGAVERERIIDGGRITPGDAVLGLASNGLHTNGYSLARRVLADADLATTPDGHNITLGDALLAPHRNYLREVETLEGAGVDIKGLAHITGGGLIDNPPRILPAGCALRLDRGSWPAPPLFELIQQLGGIDSLEMARVFNLGLGMLVVTLADQTDAALSALGQDAWCVGEIVARGDGPAVEFDHD